MSQGSLHPERGFSDSPGVIGAASRVDVLRLAESFVKGGLPQESAPGGQRGLPPFYASFGNAFLERQAARRL